MVSDAGKRAQEKWRISNRSYLAEYAQLYNQLKREEISLKKKEYYQKNKETIRLKNINKKLQKDTDNE
jgi:hypothetical protein